LELYLPEPVERKLPQLEPGYRGYVAGVLDCDGAIWISCEKTKSRPRYMLRTAVSNTRKGLPDFFVEHFGGTCRSYEKRSDKWKNEYRWAAASLPAAEVISLALPYLVIKRRQAILALEFASTIVPGQHRLPESWHEMRERLYHQMLELNKRGLK